MSSYHDCCPSLYEKSVWCHDENCYMPVLGCDALDRARIQLGADTQMYVVTRTDIDCDSVRAVRCFESDHDAIDFMVDYRGPGDYLHLRHGSEVLGWVDLCFDMGTYTRSLYSTQDIIVVEYR